jgi:hypothetical protein
MTDQELIISAIHKAGWIIAEHLEPGSRDAKEKISKLIAVLDTQELANAIEGLEDGYGLRVVK